MSLSAPPLERHRRADRHRCSPRRLRHRSRRRWGPAPEDRRRHRPAMPSLPQSPFGLPVSTRLAAPNAAPLVSSITISAPLAPRVLTSMRCCRRRGHPNLTLGAEGGTADKGEVLPTGRAALRIDAAQVDAVVPGKVLDPVGRPDRALADLAEHEEIATGTADQAIPTRTAREHVVAGTAIQHVVARGAKKVVVALLAEQLIVVVAALQAVGAHATIDQSRCRSYRARCRTQSARAAYHCRSWQTNSRLGWCPTRHRLRGCLRRTTHCSMLPSGYYPRLESGTGTRTDSYWMRSRLGRKGSARPHAVTDRYSETHGCARVRLLQRASICGPCARTGVGLQLRRKNRAGASFSRALWRRHRSA